MQMPQHKVLPATCNKHMM